jgi:hypothetical protein
VLCPQKVPILLACCSRLAQGLTCSCPTKPAVNGSGAGGQGEPQRKAQRTTLSQQASAQAGRPAITRDVLRPRFVDEKGLTRAECTAGAQPGRSQSVPPHKRPTGCETEPPRARARSVLRPRAAKTPMPPKQRVRCDAGNTGRTVLACNGTSTPLAQSRDRYNPFPPTFASAVTVLESGGPTLR